MAKRNFQLNERAVQELKQAEHGDCKASELRKMQAVRLYGTGVGRAAIGQVTQASERTIRRWVAQYQSAGVAGLFERRQGGNNRKLTDQQRHQITTQLQQYRPVDLHLGVSLYWTVSDLKVWVEQRFGVVYQDDDSYHALLHASGFSYQRSAKVYRSKPSAAEVAAFEDRLQKK